MLYTGRDQAPPMGNAARGAHQERRAVARRIDCDSAPRTAASYAPARGGAPRERDFGVRSRPGYGR